MSSNSQVQILKNVRLFDDSITDVSISNGIVKEIGNGISGEVIYDARKNLLLPGLVDLHTHLREPGREDSETVLTGSNAAIKGGFTAISPMANTFPVADTAGVVEQVFRLGIEAGLCDVFPIGAVTQDLAVVPDLQINSPIDPALPGVINISIPGTESDALLLLLDSEGISASAGSACSAGVPRPSHVLIAMGISEELADASLRISIGASNTQAEVDQVIAILPSVVERARSAFAVGKLS